MVELIAVLPLVPSNNLTRVVFAAKQARLVLASTRVLVELGWVQFECALRANHFSSRQRFGGLQDWPRNIGGALANLARCVRLSYVWRRIGRDRGGDRSVLTEVGGWIARI